MAGLDALVQAAVNMCGQPVEIDERVTDFLWFVSNAEKHVFYIVHLGALGIELAREHILSTLAELPHGTTVYLSGVITATASVRTAIASHGGIVLPAATLLTASCDNPYCLSAKLTTSLPPGVTNSAQLPKLVTSDPYVLLRNFSPGNVVEVADHGPHLVVDVA